jgi:hypothetical protein
MAGALGTRNMGTEAKTFLNGIIYQLANMSSYVVFPDRSRTIRAETLEIQPCLNYFSLDVNTSSALVFNFFMQKKTSMKNYQAKLSTGTRKGPWAKPNVLSIITTLLSRFEICVCNSFGSLCTIFSSIKQSIRQ